MLALVWSLGLLFTRIITNTLSRTVKGQVMLLVTMMLMIYPKQDISFVVFRSTMSKRAAYVSKMLHDQRGWP